MSTPLINRPRTLRFIEEAAKPGAHPVAAARAAGYSPGSSYAAAKTLMADVDVVAAIQLKREAVGQLTNISALTVLQRWLDIATADPSRIVRVRRLNCRYCWGHEHRYQWTDWEFAEKAARVMDWQPSKMHPVRPPFPDASGGFGFHFNADPCPDCPRCLGEGHVDVFLADTSTLTGAERALYAGVKTTKDGIEVKFHDQQAAWDNLRDYFGMIRKDGAPLPLNPNGNDDPGIIDVLPDDPVKLGLMYAALTKGTS
jgi:phage terminase small subunit